MKFSLQFVRNTTIILTVLILTGWGIYSLWHSPIKNIKLTDSSEYNPDIKKIHALLEQYINQSWLQLKTKELEETIKQFPWVESVSVNKEGIGDLSVNITPKKPLFRWHKNYLISLQGEHFKVDKAIWDEYKTLVQIESSTENLSILKNLIPSLTLSNKTPSLLKPLEKINIDLFTVALIYTNQRIIIDKNDAKNYLSRFYKWLNKLPAEAQKTIQKSQYIDLRYYDGFAIKQ